MCHATKLATKKDYPIGLLAGKTVDVYTDFLLHDWAGARGRARGRGRDSGSEWRTAPLIGLRHSPQYMHDGRARTVEEAILDHAGEASDSVKRFVALSASDRDAVRFVESL